MGERDRGDLVLEVDDRGGDLQAWRGVEHLPYHKIGNGVSYADPALSA